MMPEHLLHTHSLPQNFLNAPHVKNMAATPGQKCVRMDQINLGLSDVLHIPNADGQKTYKPPARSLSQVNIKFNVINELVVR